METDTTRKHCFNCENKIENEGDAFCVSCEGVYKFDDDGITIVRIEKSA